MLVDLYLIQYNNYFNRQIRRPNSYINRTSSYISGTSGIGAYNIIRSVNFNPADGVTTTLVLGKGETLTYDLDTFDYLLVVDPTIVIGHDNILSRWFIIDRDRTRDGQYTFTLRRDVVLDNLSAVTQSPVFIEKAMVGSTTDPLLYNNENMTYNQIKQSETLLKDSTTCGWVVGYIPQDAFSGSEEHPAKTISKDVPIHAQGDLEVPSISGWTYYNASNLSPNQKVFATTDLAKEIKLKTRAYVPPYKYGVYVDYPEARLRGTITIPQGGSVTTTQYNGAISYDSWSNVTANGVQGKAVNPPSNPATYNNLSGGYIAANMPGDNTLWTYVNAVITDSGTSGSVSPQPADVVNAMPGLDGKIIKDTSNGIYYRIHCESATASGTAVLDPNKTSTTNFINRLNSLKVSSSVMSGVTYYNTLGDFAVSDVESIGYNGTGYQIRLEQVQVNAQVTIDSNRNHTIDAPYDIFCIPYSDTKYLKIDGTHTVQCSKELAIGIAQEIGKQSGTNAIYDTQLLPYCPCQELINQNPNIAADNAVIDIRGLSFDVITNGVGGYLGALVWCLSATRSFDIDSPITVSSDVTERKVESECDFYRLCSGNYQGVFEFNAAKSNGVPGFRVDCTFKPFNPYIHVVPKLGGLYGDNFADYRDARGLICGGDFSLAQLSNAWANYELQNKNYQNIFDRQIQNMDVNNAIAKQEAAFSAVAGTVTGAVSGAATGAMAGGGPIGAIAGGVLGGVTGAVGGILDYQNTVKRQEENRQFAIDMYGYQLGNIKAIPTSLAKNSALTANTKIFPFIEKYSCTDTEKEVLRNKITYNGMTVMKTGVLSEFMNIRPLASTFVKGQVIRLYGFNEDAHMANAIYEEINKGVYL